MTRMKAAWAILCLTFLLQAHAQPATGEFKLPLVGKLPTPTQMHGSAIVGNRFYIFGGENPGNWTNAVHSAEIGADAQLRNWRQETALPQFRSYLVNSVEVVNDCIYLIAGSVADEPNSTEGSLKKTGDILWTRVSQDGKIGDWKLSDPMPGTPLNLGASCSTEQHIIMTGGTGKNVISSDIIVADRAKDGTPGNWRRTGTLPGSRWFHAASILNNRIYIWGGLSKRDRSAVDPQVYSAELLAGGAIGPWRLEGPMPQPTYSASCCALNDHMVSVGGRYANSYPTNVIWTSRLQNGQALDWRMLQTDLKTRVYHSLAMDRSRGWVFISGGRSKTTPDAGSGEYLAEVQAFQLTQPAQEKLDQKQVMSTTGGSMETGLQAAVAAGKSGGKQVLAYFYSSEVPACRRAWDQVINTPAYKELSSRYTLASIDVLQPAGAADARRVVALRVPALVLLNSDGTVVNRTGDLSSMAEVKTLLTGSR